MTLELKSPCKVNLLLNILGRRPDGFHELETVLQPVPLHDRLAFARKGAGLQLSCSDASLPVDESNLVHRAASAFLDATGIREGVRIHLEKYLPMAAGLGGGSANAAITLIGLNRLFDSPLNEKRLEAIAGTLGSDVPFFLQNGPALGKGRGEQVRSLKPFKALEGKALLLVRPGFGVSTPWAYQNLARFPEALNGTPGRADQLIALLQQEELSPASTVFYNSLEAPVFHKYPWLALLKEHLLEQGALAALMSGSGSTTFAIARNREEAERLREGVLGRFGETSWTSVVLLSSAC